MMVNSIDLYRMRYGEAAANYMAQLEKQHKFEDPQDISHIHLPIYVIIRLPPTQQHKQSPTKSN